MSPKKADDGGDLPDAEIECRRDAALLRALSTPPKPHSEMKIGRAREPKAADSCVAIVEKAIAANRRYRRKAV